MWLIMVLDEEMGRFRLFDYWMTYQVWLKVTAHTGSNFSSTLFETAC
jgi:hypothetical protein